MRIISSLLFTLFSWVSIETHAQYHEWKFTHITYTTNDFTIIRGSALVDIESGRLIGNMTSENGVEYILEGNIKDNSVSANFSISNSDFHIGTLLKGTYTNIKTHGSETYSKTIVISDGINTFILGRDEDKP